MPEKRSILLIYPPISKPSEPSAGLAKLKWSLKTKGVDCRVYDAGLDGIIGLINTPMNAGDTWSRRALANRSANIDALRSISLYRNRDRYKRAVMDTNRVLHMAGIQFNTILSLSNYGSAALSPVRSQDLLRAAEQFEANPFYSIFYKQLTRYFAQREPDIVGLSINFLSQALCAFAIAGFIKNHYPRIRIVCGGGLVTSWMNIPDMGNPFGGLVDELVCGPGEGRLIEMCTGEKTTVSSCTGYDYTAVDLSAYLSPLRILPYSTSRGCYWKKCAFCPEKSENGPYLTANPQIIGMDLRRSVEMTTPGLIHFLDNALSPRFLGHLIDHPPGVPWYGFARITRHLTDPDFVRNLKASGCVMLKLGVESGDQDVIDALSKGIELETVSNALHAISEAGIATYVYLLFGTPAENEESARRTLDFARRHAAFIDFLNLAIFNLPAHSEEADRLETIPFYAGDLSLYRKFVHPRGWSRDRVRRFLTKEFKKPASIRKILNNDPPFFTSNHAALFRM